MSIKQIMFQIPVVLIALIWSVSSAQPLAPNSDKLSLLGEHGYEVISGEEEFLAPIESDSTSNGIDIPAEGQEIIKQSKPDILLYGKFYVLRRKGLIPVHLESKEITSKILTTKPQDIQITGFRSLLPEDNFKDEIYNRNDQDSILFPSDHATKPIKKYIRYHKTQEEGTHTQQPLESHKTLQQPSTIFTRSIDKEIIPTPSTTTSTLSPELWKSDETVTEAQQEEESNENLDGMSSNEFISWVKERLDTQQISKLLQGIDIQVTTTAHPDIGYNSFILTPARETKCPEGQVRNHRGGCSQKYVHNPSSSNIQRRMHKGNAKVKLTSLFETLKALERDMENVKDTEKVLAEEIKNVQTVIQDYENGKVERESTQLPVETSITMEVTSTKP